MAQRMAMNNAAKQGYGMSGQAAMAGLAERQGAQNALGQVLQGARGQDQGLAQFNAGTQLQNRGQNDQYGLGLRGMELQNALGQQQGGIAYEQERGRRFGAMMGTPTEKEQAFTMGSRLGGMAMMSDERLKENVQDGGEDVSNFLRELEPKSWNYKDEKHGEGRQYGVMAQALERTKVGKQAVYETPEGKAVHYGKLAAVLTGAAVEQNRRLDRLEGKK
jgi:hypothetical protein